MVNLLLCPLLLLLLSLSTTGQTLLQGSGRSAVSYLGKIEQYFQLTTSSLLRWHLPSAWRLSLRGWSGAQVSIIEKIQQTNHFVLNEDFTDCVWRHGGETLSAAPTGFPTAALSPSLHSQTSAGKTLLSSSCSLMSIFLPNCTLWSNICKVFPKCWQMSI